MEQSQIHTGRPAAGTVKLCIYASSSEGHDECSGLEGKQPARIFRASLL